MVKHHELNQALKKSCYPNDDISEEELDEASDRLLQLCRLLYEVDQENNKTK